MINSEEIKIIIEKSRIFKKEIEITTISLDEEFHNIIGYYKTTNSDIIENLANDFKYSFKNLTNTNNYEVDTLEKELQSYIDTSNKNKKLFDKLTNW